MRGLHRKGINQMKRWSKQLLSGCLVAALLLSMGGCQQGSTPSSAVSSQAASSAAASSEETAQSPAQSSETYSDMPVQTLELDASDPDYYQKALETEIYNYKLIRNVPTAYTADSWEAYTSTANTLLNIDPASLDDVSKSMIDNAVEKREALVQVAPAADCMWYIWGDAPATAETVESSDFTAESYDNADMKPFLVPYLVEDQSTAKGNMIVIAGGGYSSRGNAMEGYPIAEAFRDLGYNAYVLQRRVAPYSEEDVWLDMQRAVRYLRYNADSLGLGGMDCMAASGFSGGSGTILGEVAYLYGDVQPTLFDPDYTPDEVDQMSADLDVICPLYGPQYSAEHTSDYAGLVTDNPNLPAMFLAVGENDATGAMPDIWTLANSVRGKTVVEVHTFAEVGHGFGAGLQGTTSTYWIPMADTFIDLVMGRGEAGAGEAAEIPEGYTQMQQYTFEGGFGKADVTCAVDDAKTKVYMAFVAFDQQQVVEGVLNDGIVTVTYDKSGFMTNDAQAIYNAADQNNWQPVA